MVETARLLIIPLSHAQLVKYVQSDPSLETELQLQPAIRSFSPALAEALEHSILPKLANPKNDYRFFTLWTIILKKDRTVVGDLCFKGEPDEKGEIEIGYGTYDAFRKKGYMTEALGGMIDWARGQKIIKAITAETEVTNLASLKVLEHNQFVVYRQKGDSVSLRLNLKNKRLAS